MKIKSLLARPYASIVHNRIRKGMLTACNDQDAILQHLVTAAQATFFGKEHSFKDIKNHSDYINSVPVRDYEKLSPYIQKVKDGAQNILWKGRPLYFAKTSGTTSGVKYIPISKESIPHHINGARNTLLCYMAETGNTAFADRKMIFLSGSPEMDRVSGIPTGRLSGIVNHFVPKYLRGNQMPSYETNCIEDWETKLDRIVAETLHEDMSLISGIPPWMQMYFDRLSEKMEGKRIKQLFPNLQVIVHGGVNFEPYRPKLEESLGSPTHMLETFPASEGFFAFQDLPEAGAGLLLNTNAGMYFEFIPVNELSQPNPTRLSLRDVKAGEQYALIVSSNAGLWAYDIGDTVRFTSTEPYRLVVSGRVKHYISAFGEHVIAEEVEYALTEAMKGMQAKVVEFTVAPQVQVNSGRPYHEWFIEFEQMPDDIRALSTKVDTLLRQKNIYYDDLITGNILQPLKITPVKKSGFIEYMKSVGKLGGQNKVPRLSNDRKLADALTPWVAAL